MLLPLFRCRVIQFCRKHGERIRCVKNPFSAFTRRETG